MASSWKEAKAQDGRTYYYNTQTKETSWTLPASLAHSNSSNASVDSTSSLSISASSSADENDDELPPSYSSLPGTTEEKERFEALEKRVSAAIQREQKMNKQLQQLLSKMESVSGILGTKH